MNLSTLTHVPYRVQGNGFESREILTAQSAARHGERACGNRKWFSSEERTIDHTHLALGALTILLCKALVSVIEFKLTTVNERMQNIVCLAVHRITRAHKQCCALTNLE